MNGVAFELARENESRKCVECSKEAALLLVLSDGLVYSAWCETHALEKLVPDLGGLTDCLRLDLMGKGDLFCDVCGFAFARIAGPRCPRCDSDDPLEITWEREDEKGDSDSAPS